MDGEERNERDFGNFDEDLIESGRKLMTTIFYVILTLRIYIL